MYTYIAEVWLKENPDHLKHFYRMKPEAAKTNHTQMINIFVLQLMYVYIYIYIHIYIYIYITQHKTICQPIIIPDDEYTYNIGARKYPGREHAAEEQPGRY